MSQQTQPSPLFERSAARPRSAGIDGRGPTRATRSPSGAAATVRESSGEPPGRVLLIAPEPFYAERGTPIAVRHVLAALSELGFEADLLTLPLGHDVAISGVHVIRVANPFGFRSIPIGFSLRKLVFDGLILAKLIKRLRRHDYILIHAFEEGALLALLARGWHTIPVIYDMQSSLPEQLAQKRTFRVAFLQAVFRSIEALLLRRATVVVCSAGLADHARSLAPETPLREWYFPSAGPDAAPDKVAALRAELGMVPSAPVVLYTGNFAPYQGLDLLLHAVPQVVQEVTGVTFVLVGAATQDEIDSCFERLNEDVRDRVRCLMRQPRDRIDVFIGMATVLVSPRSYGGNFPLKVFDYLAAAKPIVATAVPAHHAVLDDRLALLVEPRADALAAGIVRVLNDPRLRTSLAVSARDFAERELSWSRFVGFIDELVATASGAR